MLNPSRPSGRGWTDFQVTGVQDFTHPVSSSRAIRCTLTLAVLCV